MCCDNSFSDLSVLWHYECLRAFTCVAHMFETGASHAAMCAARRETIDETDDESG